MYNYIYKPFRNHPQRDVKRNFTGYPKVQKRTENRCNWDGIFAQLVVKLSSKRGTVTYDLQSF